MLNASYEPLNVTSVRRAHVLVFKGKAEVIEELHQPLHSATDTYPWPHVIRLVAYVRVPRAVQRKISRRALFARDGWRCVYCGDHRWPADPRPRRPALARAESRCGRTSSRRARRATTARATARWRKHAWSCSTRRRPPAPVLFIRLAAPKIPNGWQPYLAHFGARHGNAPRALGRRARPAARAAPTRSTSRDRACRLVRRGAAWCSSTVAVTPEPQ